MSKYSKLNQTMKNHDERLSNHDERICEIEKVLGIGDFMAIAIVRERATRTAKPAVMGYRKEEDEGAGPVILTKDDEQRLVAHQASLLPVAQKTFYSNPQNTPEKKNRRKDWCLRLVVIHGECGMTAKDVQKHANDKGNTWRRIKQAASLEITDTNKSQNLPYAMTIADYASRINFVLHDKIATAQIEGNTKNVQLYNSRSDHLIAIVNEINSSYPNTLKKLNAA
jgi:hypothetical protein